MQTVDWVIRHTPDGYFPIIHLYTPTGWVPRVLWSGGVQRSPSAALNEIKRAHERLAKRATASHA